LSELSFSLKFLQRQIPGGGDLRTDDALLGPELLGQTLHLFVTRSETGGEAVVECFKLHEALLPDVGRREDGLHVDVADPRVGGEGNGRFRRRWRGRRARRGQGGRGL